MTTSRINILLSTFRGEVFLPEQLASIAWQIGVDWHLFWRDDLSDDHSVACMERFSVDHPGRITQIRAATGRLGAAKSYITLLTAVSEKGLFAFCDQDDIWLPEKLSLAASALSRIPADIPALYCSRQHLVDRNLNPLGLSPPIRHPPSFRNALVQNIATGCTIVMNSSARNVVLSVPISANSVHDWWSYLTVTGAGGRVIFEDVPSILYRQHENNTIGSSKSFLTRLKGVVKRGPLPFLHITAGHITALEQTILSDEARELLSALRLINKAGVCSRVFKLKKLGIYRQGLLETFVLWFWLILYNIPFTSTESSMPKDIDAISSLSAEDSQSTLKST